MRRKDFDEVLQFKITLEGIRTSIWRRIQVPDFYSFWDLHVAIQDSMGWRDSHLHEFEVYFPETEVTLVIGIPIPEEDKFEDDDAVMPGWNETVTDCFEERKPEISYLYDFGDDWNHAVEFEGVHPRKPGLKYPLCLDGARACPPEDCGGIYGYAEMLEIIADKNHEEYEDTVRWMGPKFDPEHFDPRKVRFDNPVTRLRKSIE